MGSSLGKSGGGVVKKTKVRLKHFMTPIAPKGSSSFRNSPFQNRRYSTQRRRRSSAFFFSTSSLKKLEREHEEAQKREEEQQKRASWRRKRNWFVRRRTERLLLKQKLEGGERNRNGEDILNHGINDTTLNRGDSNPGPINIVSNEQQMNKTNGTSSAATTNKTAGATSWSKLRFAVSSNAKKGGPQNAVKLSSSPKTISTSPPRTSRRTKRMQEDFNRLFPETDEFSMERSFVMKCIAKEVDDEFDTMFGAGRSAKSIVIKDRTTKMVQTMIKKDITDKRKGRIKRKAAAYSDTELKKQTEQEAFLDFMKTKSMKERDWEKEFGETTAKTAATPASKTNSPRTSARVQVRRGGETSPKAMQAAVTLLEEKGNQHKRRGNDNSSYSSSAAVSKMKPGKVVAMPAGNKSHGCQDVPANSKAGGRGKQTEHKSGLGNRSPPPAPADKRSSRRSLQKRRSSVAVFFPGSSSTTSPNATPNEGAHGPAAGRRSVLTGDHGGGGAPFGTTGLPLATRRSTRASIHDEKAMQNELQRKLPTYREIVNKKKRRILSYMYHVFQYWSNMNSEQLCEKLQIE
ncbi:unnamed protein product [Amoebophrya sp. A120]|nr:unnamed protein product [Amoebophrya sp. A120]|eukprot:GSA120T00013918001.1